MQVGLKLIVFVPYPMIVRSILNVASHCVPDGLIFENCC